MCREQHSTITNAHTVRRRPVAGSNHIPEPPAVDLRLLPGRWGIVQHGDLGAVGVLGQVRPNHRRTLATEAARPRSLVSR